MMVRGPAIRYRLYYFSGRVQSAWTIVQGQVHLGPGKIILTLSLVSAAAQLNCLVALSSVHSVSYSVLLYPVHS